MAKLSDDLKRMLAGLAYQDAGDFLSIREKMKVLDPGATDEVPLTLTRPAVDGAGNSVSRPLEKNAATKRIAFISDGSGLDTPLDYVIDNSLLQGAQIDLLIHGVNDMKKIAALEKKIQDAGIRYELIHLKASAVDGVIDYITSQSSLIFLVAMPDDAVAKVLVEDVLPKRGHRIHAPLVLIKDQLAAAGTQKQTAA